MSNKQLFEEWYAQDQTKTWPEWLESKLLEARAELAAGNHLYAQATDRINDMAAEILRAHDELDENQQLYDLQHTRTVEADKLFQAANGVDYFPDLGQLVEWLMARYDKLRAELATMTADRDSEARWAEQYHAELDILKAASAWIPVGERLPDSPMSDDYLVILENGMLRQAIFWPEKSKRYWTWKGERFTSDVAFWMLPPKKPESEVTK